MVNQEVEELQPELVDIPERDRRQYSTIAFPYTDLEAVVTMARALKDQHGTTPCSEEQLAVWLGQTANGGTFRSRLSAGKMFGLIEAQKGRVTLTDGGLSVVDYNLGAGAKADAFLRVPLYSALYEQFKGHVLPPASALERQMVSLGVAAKQKERARQTFLKSAHYAGYIDQQSSRFIRPGVGAIPAPQTDTATTEKHGGGGDEPPNLDPFILGLLRKLPPADAAWPIQDQAKWLRTAASIFGLMYPAEGSISVEVVENKS